MNRHAKYRLEVHAMETGKWYSALIDTENNSRHVWESRDYEDMEDAYYAGKCEWDEVAEGGKRGVTIGEPEGPGVEGPLDFGLGDGWIND